MANLLKVASLWRGRDKNGNETLSGNIDVPVGIVINDTHRLVIFENDKKTAQNQPDFNVFVTRNEPQGG